MSPPDVSVVTAAYNAADAIERALESVRQQTVDESRIEHIVVDDGSTDQTASLVDSFEAPYLRLISVDENTGDGTIACNRGIRTARGEFVIVLDADDEFSPSLVERSAAVLTSDSAVDFVYTDYVEAFPNGERTIVETGLDIMQTVKVGMMHRSDRLHQFGLYNPQFIFAEYDLLMQYLNAGLEGYHIPGPLFIYHRQKDSQTANTDRVRKGKQQLVQKYGDDFRMRDYDF